MVRSAAGIRARRTLRDPPHTSDRTPLTSPTAADEERIALFLDYENLAIGARDKLGGLRFDMKPLAEALAERGRVVVRKAYADWSMFSEDRRMLTRNHVELIEIPQRMGMVRKNSADIKMALTRIRLAWSPGTCRVFGPDGCNGRRITAQ